MVSYDTGWFPVSVLFLSFQKFWDLTPPSYPFMFTYADFNKVGLEGDNATY